MLAITPKRPTTVAIEEEARNKTITIRKVNKYRKW